MNKTIDALKLAEGALYAELESDTCEEFAEAAEKCHKALAAIREALAEPEITTPDVCGEVCARAKLCYGCGKAFDEALADHIADVGKVIAEPVKQEPVAKVTDVFPTRVEWLREVAVNSLLYAAPVSAKREWVDLTVSDLDAIIEKNYDDEMDLKAMILDGIAAYKEKNK